MLKKIVITLFTLIGVIFLPFAFIIASIYFTWKPGKIDEWNQEAKDIQDLDSFLKSKSESNNNTGMH